MLMHPLQSWGNYNIGIKYFIWIFWFVLVVLWNYTYPNAHPWEDVFVTVCLSLLSKYLEKTYG